MAITEPQRNIFQILDASKHAQNAAHELTGPSRTAKLPRACSGGGGGSISKNEDGTKCAIAGKECTFEILFALSNQRLKGCNQALRILSVQDPFQDGVVGDARRRITASRNFWEGSGLKLDSSSTDVAWARGSTYWHIHCMGMW